MKIPAILRLVCAVVFGCIFCQRATAGDTVITNGGQIDLYTFPYTLADVGQTFTATASGLLTKIEIAAESGAAAGVSLMKVYAGSGTGGDLLYSKTVDLSSVDTVTSSTVYTWYAITIDSDVVITSGQVYTFVLSPGTNSNIGFGYFGLTGARYAGGAMYSADFAGTNLDYDLVFRVTQSSVVATELRFTTQPSGSVSGAAFTGQPVVKVTDARGNVDTTFTGNVTLALGSGAGSLSGTLTKAAVAGVATFTDVVYTATADQQAFTLTTANTAALTNATSNSVTSDVVATKLRFSTQPAPLTMASAVTRAFTTAPVVQAVDAANVVDTDYSTAIVLSLTKNDGTAVAGTVNSVAATDDTDGSATTVTLAPSSGAATFTELSVRYTHAASTDSLALHATSGALVAANSAAITCREDAAPVVNTLITGGTFTEDGPAVAVSYAATVTDADDLTCAWATVSIVQNFTADQDVLSFTNDGSTMGNITAVYDAGTGVLTLTSAGATATKIQWGNAVKVVKYANTSHTPNTATRQMVFVANDGLLSSDANFTYCKTNVSVVAVNDAPTIGGAVAGQTVNDTSTISPFATLTISDPDSDVSATVALDTAAKGTFTLGSLASSGFATADGGATYTHAATTPAAMQIAIRRLVFVPAANRVAAGLTETTTFSVTISDGVAAPVTNATTTVVSTSVNNAPVVTSGGAVTVQEHQTAACTVTGSDLDPGAVLSYAISGGADAALFTIDAATGVVTFNSAPNFESPSDAGGNNVYDIIVTASDGVLTSTLRAVAITVINANEQPTDLALTGATVAQAAGTNAPVGTLSTSDPDAGDTFTYTLVAGTGATDNASFNISGAALRATNPALLAAGNHSVRIRSTDAGGLWVEKAFVVTVTDNLGPTVASVTGPPAGVYRCGENLEFTVRFDDAVLVTGTPKLNLTIGGVAHTATYVSGSGSTDLLFRYTVVQGDHAASGEVIVGTIDLSGATIRDSVANDATLGYTPPTLTGVLVDALTHSADTNADWRISLVELTRVIELYNNRSGTIRTGEYHCEPGTEDGFAPGPGTLTSCHSADTDGDGRISLTELTRVIELYNARNGTTRTGDYHGEAGTEDGFSPGPQ
jgi:hypothetical protein